MDAAFFLVIFRLKRSAELQNVLFLGVKRLRQLIDVDRVAARE